MAKLSRYWYQAAIGLCVIAISVPAVALALGHRNLSLDAGKDPLRGIAASSADPSATVDSKSMATLDALNQQGAGKNTLGAQLVDKARVMSTMVGGKRLYLVPTEKGALCAFREGGTEACTAPLTESNPALVVADDSDGPGGIGPIVFGVALDGVTSVSVTTRGGEQSIAVTKNVFVYQASSETSAADVSGVAATLANGGILSIP